MKRITIYLLFCSLSSALFSGTGNEPVKKLIDEFLSTDWPTVLSAKEKIENLGAGSISDVIAIMDECRVHKMQNTGDLIFPGANKYFGHGQIIDYDIDDICVRAGWLLEDLTFLNFGFTGIHLPDNELAGFIRDNFDDYYSDPANRKQLNELSVTATRKLIRALSIERARRWWQNTASGWNRLNALEEALNSVDEKCQVKALFYLRNGKTRCPGLNESYYKTRLEGTVMKLTRASLGRVSENAKLIMLDSDFDWLRIKPVD